MSALGANRIPRDGANDGNDPQSGHCPSLLASQRRTARGRAVRKYLRISSPSVAASGSLQTLQCTSRLGDWGSAFTRTTLYCALHFGHLKSAGTFREDISSPSLNERRNLGHPGILRLPSVDVPACRAPQGNSDGRQG